MVATDTVVGIVGAVLLVAVMGGVFAYEYNNPAEAEDLSDAGQQEHFEEDYSGMSATDDIDGDGKPNYMDEDIDGDGTENGNDTSVSYHAERSGALGPSGGPVSNDLTFPFVVGNGSVHVTSTVTTSAQVANPLFPGNFVIELLRPDGSIADNQAYQPGGSNTFTVETQDDEIPAGTWSVRVSQNTVGTGGSADISVDVHYPDIAMGHGSTPEKR
jgi:hypothetical protein